MSLLDTDAKTVFLSQRVERTRREDEALAPEDLVGESAPRVLDSLEATRRLASFTGLTSDTEQDAVARATVTGKVSGLERQPAEGWRGRDWLLVGIAALLGLLAAAAILRSGVGA